MGSLNDAPSALPGALSFHGQPVGARRSARYRAAEMPPELKPLLAIVIGMAILHAVLKVRARVGGRAGARAARRKEEASIVADDLGGLSPEEALARLRERAGRSGSRP